MGNVADPRDDALLDLRISQNRILHAFNADGSIDPSEQTALNLLDNAIAQLSDYRLREKAADTWVKVGTMNKYVRGLYRDAGVEIPAVPVNVTQFRQRQSPPRDIA
ncbi:MAG: hypothetical protein ACR2OE_14900 [Thermomicrobiales bacterium]